VRDDALYQYCASLLSGGVGDASILPQSLADCAQTEGVSGLLMGLPALAQAELAPQYDALRKGARNDAMRELAASVEASRVLSLLDAAGIRPLVLKGSALAMWLYREPWLRPRSDLDLLVEDMATAHRVVDLLQQVGYVLVAGVGPAATDGYEVALQRQSGIVIDLHWRLLNHAVLERFFPYVELAAEAIPLPGLYPNALGLGKRHALFHALLHRITNLAKGGVDEGDRLIWLVDIQLLAQACDDEDWQVFLRLCSEKGIATPSLDGLRAARDALGVVLPPKVEDALTNLAMQESWTLLDGIDQAAMDRTHLAALPWPEKIAWLRHKLLPSPEFMRHRYGVKGVFGVASAYLWRWWYGVKSAVGR
jgi:hypothetical protein